MSSAVSPTKAAELANVSRQTIYNDMESGELSFKKQGKRKRTIDVSELERRYGKLNIPSNKTIAEPIESRGEVSNDVKDSSNSFTSLQNKRANGQNELVELAVSREKIQNLETLVENLKDERDYLRGALEKAQNNETHLLEDKRSESEKAEDWKKVLEDMKKKISAYELKEEQTKQGENSKDRENSLLKQKLDKTEKALEAEKNKTVWDKITGK